MKLNKPQKLTIKIGAGFISLALIIWMTFGGHIFTQTQILIDKKDELFDTTYKEWKQTFVLGLDYTMAFIAIIIIICGIFLFKFKNKTKEANEINI